jgi:ABC-type transport system substrate-binding protein
VRRPGWVGERVAFQFVFSYALHDALIQPLPGNPMTPCLAESWTESADGLVDEFKLREGSTFQRLSRFKLTWLPTQRDRGLTTLMP